jgi:folate-binding protein YgfZ
MSRGEVEASGGSVPAAHLSDRGVVRVSGEEARKFLDGLVTCDMDRVAPEAPRFGALLTPQGKILFDFLIFQAPAEDGGGFYLDCAKFLAPDLAKRLGFYKLRAKVAIEDLSERLAVVAGWGASTKPAEELGLAADDPRLPALGWRAIVASEDAAAFAEAEPQAYHAHRIALGVPEGGKDFLFSDAFPHEALMDQLNGIDFEKGCYVGQEVVSRMQHRGTARTRIVPAVYQDGFVAEPGAEVTAGERSLGKTGTGANGRGLLMLRLDRAADALAAGETLRAGGLPVTLEKPGFASFAFPGQPVTPAE